MTNTVALLAWTAFCVGQTVTPTLPTTGFFTQTTALGLLAWQLWGQRADTKDDRDMYRKERELDREDRAKFTAAINANTEAMNSLKTQCAGEIARRDRGGRV